MKPRLLADTFTCTMCKLDKPYYEFKKNKIRFSGYASYCLQCHRERTAQKRKNERYKIKFNSQDALNNLFATWSKGQKYEKSE